MNLRLVGYECLLMWRERTSILALLCLAVLVLVSLAGNGVALARADAERVRITAAERERWLTQGEKDPHSAAHYSIHAFKPVSPLAILDLGIEAYVGRAVWLEAHVQNDLLHRPQGDATPLERTGLQHPAGLILAFGPLAVFLLAFSRVAMDRERGIMRLALGAGASPGALLGSKCIAVWGSSVAALVLPATAVAAFWLAFQSTISVDSASRLGLWCLVMTAYLGIASLVGTAIAMRAPSVRTALVALFGLWCVFAFVMPRSVSAVAESRVPLPSTQAVRQQLQDEAPAYWTAEQARANQARLHAHAGGSRSVNLRGAELDLNERHSHAVFDRILGAFHARVIAQDAAFFAWSWLSPTAAVHGLSQALVGTDYAHHCRFVGAAERYRRDLVNRMNADVMAHPTSGDTRHTRGNAFWASVPAFEPPVPRLRDTARHVHRGLAALLLWLAFSVLLVVAIIRRVRP